MTYQPTLEDVEVAMLRRFENAYKANDTATVNKLHSAIEVFRQAVAEVRAWT